MLTNLVLFITLVFFSLTVSQPLFYWMALRNTSRNLSASAYIEMRNQIDTQMRRRGPVAYYGTLIFSLILAIIAFTGDDPVLRIASFTALLGLVTDIALMMKGNVPINKTIQVWTPELYPSDWQDYRDRWLRIFGYRQVALCISFFSLLAGAVFR